MIAPPLYLAVDQGTHASRALVVDRRGEIVAAGERQIALARPQADWAEQDGEEVVASVFDAAAQAIAALGERRDSVGAAGLASQRSSCVCWDRRDGRVLSPIFSWQDRRAHAWISSMEAEHGEAVHRATGLYLSPHYGASKLRWALDNLPEVRKARDTATLAWGPMTSFLTFRLLKERPMLADPQCAARTQLWNLETRDWDPELLKLFGPASMVATEGLGAAEPGADYRAEACRYYDDRIGAAQRLAFVHELLGRDMTEVRMAFDRIEKLLASLGEAERARPDFIAVQGAMAADAATREKYLALARATEDPALRVRMVSVARNVGWLSESQQRAELARMIGDVLRRGSAGFGEVDMICTLNRDRALDAELTRFSVARLAATPANAAALACLGSIESRARVLDALLSADENEVQVAQAYLRHRPLADAHELRAVVAGIARMKAASAQARALETLARHHVTDAETLAQLAALFARSTDLRVQRAIAEVFIRSGPAGLETPGLAELIRRHRIKSPDGADLIDALVARLAA